MAPSTSQSALTESVGLSFYTRTDAASARSVGKKYGDAKKRKLADDDSFRRDAKGRGTSQKRLKADSAAGFGGARLGNGTSGASKAGRKAAAPTKAKAKGKPIELSSLGPEPVTPTKTPTASTGTRRSRRNMMEEESDDELALKPAPQSRAKAPTRSAQPTQATPTKVTKFSVVVPPTPPSTVKRGSRFDKTAENATEISRRSTRSRAQVEQLPTPTATPTKRKTKAVVEEEDDSMEVDQPLPTPPRTGRRRVHPLMGSSTPPPSGQSELSSGHDDGTDEACFSAADAAAPLAELETDVDADEEEEEEEQSTAVPVPRTPAASSVDAFPTSRRLEPSANAIAAASPQRLAASGSVFPSHVALPMLRSLFPVLSTTSPIPVRFDATQIASDTSLEARRKSIATTPCLPGLGDSERDLRSVLGRCVWEGEGNAMILVGGRGSGKSAIVSRALDFVRHPAIGGSSQSFLLIRLNGLVQRTDRLALREMARQLFVGGFGASASVAAKILQTSDGDGEGSGEQDEVEGEQDALREGAGNLGSYADTLSSLLGALEPDRGDLSSAAPAEGEGEQESTPAQVERTKPLVIVLDEFDLFADRTRQSFLYTLLDIVQGNRRRGGMAVIGLTSAVNVLEQLEKRVKSRCQSRVHYLAPPGRTAEERSEVCKAVLELPSSTNGVSRGECDAFAEVWQREVERFVEDKRTQTWMENLWYLRAEAVPKVLQQLHPMLASFFARNKNAEDIDISKALDPSALPLRSSGPPRNLLTSLGAVDMSLVVAAKHLTAGDPAINFELCYDLYRKHCKRATEEAGFATQIFSRHVLATSWDRLQRLEVILPFSNTARAAATAATGGRAFRMFKLVPWLAHVDQEAERRADLPRHLKMWCKNASD